MYIKIKETFPDDNIYVTYERPGKIYPPIALLISIRPEPKTDSRALMPFDMSGAIQQMVDKLLSNSIR